MNNFARMLKYYRKLNKLTQKELAGKLKISKSAVSMYENGKRQPDFEILDKISDFFDVDLITMINGRSDSDSAGEEILINCYRSVERDSRDKIIEYAKRMKQLHQMDVQAANTRTDIEVTKEGIKCDNDMMDNDKERE